MVLCGACTLVFLLGALRCMAAIPRPDDPAWVAHYNDRSWVTLEGVVRDYPDRRDTWTALSLDVEKIEFEGQSQKAHGTVLVRAARFPDYDYGDRLRASGLLQTPPELEGFSYRAYLANRASIRSWSAPGSSDSRWMRAAPSARRFSTCGIAPGI